MLNPTQLTHLSLCLGLGSPLFPLWSSLTLGLALIFVTGPALLLLGKGAAPAPLPVPPFPGLLSLDEQLGLAAPLATQNKNPLGDA